MSLALLLPVGLAALAATLLPLLIHLARRNEERRTVFAALHWLQRKPKPRQRIRFDEWPLLLVRLLLLVLFALLLARPVLHGTQDEAPRVAVAPGVELPADRAALAPADARWLRLEPGLPPIEADAGAPVADARGASVTSLLRELDASLPPGAALTVLVPEVLDGVDAQRPVLSRAVDWRVVPAATPAARPVPDATPPPRLAVRYAPGHASGVRYLRAAQAAWTPPGRAQPRVEQDVAPLPSPIAPATRQLAWLAPGALPAEVCEWVQAGGTVLLDVQALPCASAPAVVVWRDEDGRPLVEAAPHGRGRMLRFTRPLDPQSMPVLLDGTFPARLRALFEPAPAPPARVSAAAHAPLTGAAAYAQPPLDLQGWLVALIVLLFGVERWIATAARRGAP
jgi:hypothetical protein